MPTIRTPITPRGDIVNGEIHAAKVHVPPGTGATSLKMLLDSGATQTCVSRGIIAALGPHEIAAVWIRGATGVRARVGVYEVKLVVSHPAGASFDFVLACLPVLAVASWPGLDVLVGRDVLDRIEYHRDGPGGHFELRY